MNLKEAPTKRGPIGEFQEQKYYHASYKCFPKVELRLKDTDYNHERTIAINCNSKDGVKPMTKEEQEFERQLNRLMIKKFTMSIFKMDVTKFSFPVGYNEQRTFIERATDLFSFLVTDYIDLALQQTNPVERLSYLATGVIAGFHLYLQQKKPWNPLLGETYVGEWPNGTRMYGEQTCHHPPVSCIQIEPKNKNWKINAQFNFGIDPGVTKIIVLQKGLTKLELKDGTVVEWEFPNIVATGILTGERVLKVGGPFSMHDIKNRIDVVININPSKSDEKHYKKDQKELLNMTPEEVEQMLKDEKTEKVNNKKNCKKKEVKLRATAIQGGIKNSGRDNFLMLIQGDYCNQIFVNDRKVWDIRTNISSRPLKEIPDCDMLPSDCRFRIDRGMYIQNRMDDADKAKNLIEELQRHDYKLRESVPKPKK